jgi:hypothetical protein
MKYVLIAVLLGVGHSAAAQNTVTNAPLSERLNAARALWQQAGFDQYVYGFNKFCECHRETPPETLVEVTDEAITDVRHIMVKTGDTVPAAARNFALYWTVEDLFDLLERASRSEAVVRADFDDELGLPRRIFIDYLPDVVGDELDVRVTRFEAR